MNRHFQTVTLAAALGATVGLAALSGSGCGSRSALYSLGTLAAGGSDGGSISQAGAGGSGTTTVLCGSIGDSCMADDDCCDLPCYEGLCVDAIPPCANDQEPVALSLGLFDPYAMGGDATNLYVGQLQTSKALLRISKKGGPAELVVPDVNYVDFLTVQEKTVFYSNENAVNAVTVAGGTPTVLTGAFGPAGLAVTSSKVYVAEYLAKQLLEIDRSSLQTKVLQTGVDGIYRVAATESAVYFSTFLDGLFRHDLTTGALDVIASDLGSPRAVLAFHDDVYFTVPNQQKIYRLSGSSVSPELISDMSAFGLFMEALVTDGTYLYTTMISGLDEGLILRTPIGGGSPEVVSPAAGTQPSALVVDNACIYWSEREKGAVFRARKTPL